MSSRCFLPLRFMPTSRSSSQPLEFPEFLEFQRWELWERKELGFAVGSLPHSIGINGAARRHDTAACARGTLPVRARSRSGETASTARLARALRESRAPFRRWPWAGSDPAVPSRDA